MDTTFQAAIFTATRSELLGRDPLPASAEIARCVCRTADRTVSVLAVTSTRIRRIDGWLGRTGVVTHAAATDPGVPLVGSVCDRDRSPTLVRELVRALVGHVPARAAETSFEMPTLGAVTPASLPGAVGWMAVITTSSYLQAPSHFMIAAVDGLLAGDVVVVDRPVRLEPFGPARLDERLADLVREPPRSIRDLIIGD